MRLLVDEAGEPLGLHQLPDEVAARVAGYRRKADGSIEIKLESKNKALELLARNLGLLREQMHLETSDQLTPYEQQRIDALSDQELVEWNIATATIERLLHPQEEIVDVTSTTRSLTA